MNRLEAHERFTNRTDRSALPADFTVEGADVWPAAATAAVELAGYLDAACVDDADLDAGLAHFESLFSMEIIGEETWTRTAFEVLRELMAFGMETDRIAAMN